MTESQDQPSPEESQEPLGIKHPFLPHKPLGQKAPGLRFMVPTGTKSISVLDPSIFSPRETLQQTTLHQSFEELPFFQPTDLSRLSSPLSAQDPSPVSSPTLENISTAAPRLPQPSPDIPASTIPEPTHPTIQRKSDRFPAILPPDQPTLATPTSQIQHGTSGLDNVTTTAPQGDFASETAASFSKPATTPEQSPFTAQLATTSEQSSSTADSVVQRAPDGAPVTQGAPEAPADSAAASIGQDLPQASLNPEPPSPPEPLGSNSELLRSSESFISEPESPSIQNSIASNSPLAMQSGAASDSQQHDKWNDISPESSFANQPEIPTPKPSASETAPSFTEPPLSHGVAKPPSTIEASLAPKAVAPSSQSATPREIAPQPSTVSDAESATAPSNIASPNSPIQRRIAAQTADDASVPATKNQSASITPNPEISAAKPVFTQPISPKVDTEAPSESSLSTPDIDVTSELQQPVITSDILAAADVVDTSDFVQDIVESSTPVPSQASEPTSSETMAAIEREPSTPAAESLIQRPVSEFDREDGVPHEQPSITPTVLNPEPLSPRKPFPLDSSIADVSRPNVSSSDVPDLEAPSVTQRKVPDGMPSQDSSDVRSDATATLSGEISPVATDFSNTESASPVTDQESIDRPTMDDWGNDGAATTPIQAVLAQQQISDPPLPKETSNPKDTTQVEIQSGSTPENTTPIQAKASADDGSQIATTELTSDFPLNAPILKQDIQEILPNRVALTSDQSLSSDTDISVANDANTRAATTDAAIQHQVTPDSIFPAADAIPQNTAQEIPVKVTGNDPSGASMPAGHVPEQQSVVAPELSAPIQQKASTSASASEQPDVVAPTEAEQRWSLADSAFLSTADTAENGLPDRQSLPESADVLSPETTTASLQERRTPAADAATQREISSQRNASSDLFDTLLSATNSPAVQGLNTPVPDRLVQRPTLPSPFAQDVSTSAADTAIQRQISPDLFDVSPAAVDSPAVQRLDTSVPDTSGQRQSELPEAASKNISGKEATGYSDPLSDNIDASTGISQDASTEQRPSTSESAAPIQRQIPSEAIADISTTVPSEPPEFSADSSPSLDSSSSVDTPVQPLSTSQSESKTSPFEAKNIEPPGDVSQASLPEDQVVDRSSDLQQTNTPSIIQRQTAHPKQPPQEWSSVADLLSQISTPPSPPAVETESPKPDSSNDAEVRESSQSTPPAPPFPSSLPLPSSPTPSPTPSQQQAYPNLHPFDPGPQVIQAKSQDTIKPAMAPDLRAFASNDPPEERKPSEAAEADSGGASADQLEQLAQAVYQSVKQRLMIERERSGSSYSGRLF